MNKNISYVNRYKLPQYNSIEELFKNISQNIKKSYKTTWIELPCFGASPISLIKNLLYVKQKKETIYHITGDVHYMALRLGKRCILTIHDYQSALCKSRIKQKIIIWLWFKWPAKRVKYITVISHFSKNELTAVIPKQAYKIKVIYNPVSTQIQPDLNHKFNTKKPNILLIGTKVNKNFEGSINALKDLNVNLIIIGKLDLKQTKHLKKSGLNYELNQYLNFKEVIECYKKADLLCFPSFYEGFGMPIIEAQAVGRPVVTSNIGAMKEIAQESACLVDPYSTASIREGVLKIIKDKTYREELIIKGQNNIQRFQLDSIAKQYKDLYEKI